MDIQKLDLIDQGNPSEDVSLELQDMKSSLPDIFVYSFDSPNHHSERASPEDSPKTGTKSWKSAASQSEFIRCHGTNYCHGTN